MDDLASNGFNVQIPYDDDQTTQTDGVSAKRFMRAKKKPILTNTRTITHTHTHPSSIYYRTKLYGVIVIFVLAAGFVDFFLPPLCVLCPRTT